MEPKVCDDNTSYGSEMSDIEVTSGQNDVQEDWEMADAATSKGEQEEILQDDAPLEKTKSQVANSLRVQRVTEHIDERREPIHDIGRTVSYLAAQSVPDEQAPLREALQAVAQANKRARNFGEDLVEDMLVLDKLTGLASDDRAARKAAIAGIESLLEDVDASKSRLSSIQRMLQSKLEEQEKKEAAVKLAEEEASAARAAEARRKMQEDAEAAIRSVLEADYPGKGLWNTVRLPLRFHSQEGRNGYAIRATVPGLRTEDIHLKAGDDNTRVTVEGVRIPSMQEYALMRQELARRLQAALKSAPEQLVDGLNAHDLYRKLGQDTYGQFSETFRVPEDADLDGMDASYKDGVLSIVLPKVSPQVHPGLGSFDSGRYHGGHTHDRRAQYNPSYGRSGLLSGRDPDFFW